MHYLKILGLTTLLWISCSEPDGMPVGIDNNLLLVIEKPWKVALYLSQGEDLTASSSQMLFHFLDSGIIRVDNEDESYVGLWNIVSCSPQDAQEESYCLDLDFTLDSKPYQIHLPDDLWLIKSFSSERLVLTHPDQYRAQETRLILERLK